MRFQLVRGQLSFNPFNPFNVFQDHLAEVLLGGKRRKKESTLPMFLVPFSLVPQLVYGGPRKVASDFS
jgi:hypothetical protein